MKVTKYPQSCLLIEKKDTRIVIDPGTVFSSKYSVDDLGKLDAVLYTHKHADHFDELLLAPFKQAGVALFANQSTAELIKENVTTIRDKDEWVIGSFSVQARELDHCLMADDSPGPQNTGYVINDTFFHPGDGVAIEGLQVDSAAVPIAGPSVSVKDAFDFAKQIHAKRMIPIHYDVFKEDPALVAKFNDSLSLGYEVIVLQDGQSTEF